MSLTRVLDELPADLRRILLDHRFDAQRLARQAALLRAGAPVENRVHARVTAPAPADLHQLPLPGTPEYQALEARGLECLADGRCALVVLAGGMATRMGGVVKALVDALPGLSFLDLRLIEQERMKERVGRAYPLWLMTSHSTHQALEQRLGDRLRDDDLALFCQYLSLRLTPEGELFRDEGGLPSEYAPGHGDLPEALRESGLLERFVERGGRVVMIANIDNLGATVDPVILGWHLEHGAPLSCEVVDKVGSDRGGIPVRMDGRPLILEEFCLPETFDPARVRVFNTNTFHVSARELLELRVDSTFYFVTKTVNDQRTVQFERLVNELTRDLDTRFLYVPRTGPEARFLPVKDEPELRARGPEIEMVARARQILR